MVCITTLRKKLDPALSESLLFMHAFSGCDTTSKPHGIGKVTVTKKYAALSKSVTVFRSPSSSPFSSKQDIEQAGEEAMLEIYWYTTSLSLSTARVTKIQLQVATCYQSITNTSFMYNNPLFHAITFNHYTLNGRWPSHEECVQRTPFKV